MRGLALFLLLIVSETAVARLGDTRERAGARYGLPKREGTAPNAIPLLKGARELTFEHEGFQIRCALLYAKDGEWYIVRKEYRKIWNIEVMKKGGTHSIRDFEFDAILKAEAGTGPWRRELVSNSGSGVMETLTKQYLHTLGITGRVWTRDDGAVARWMMIGDFVILDLPQALKYEAELKNAKLTEQKAAAERLAQTGRVVAPLSSTTSTQDPTPRPAVTIQPVQSRIERPATTPRPVNLPLETKPEAAPTPTTAKRGTPDVDFVADLIGKAVMAIVGIALLKLILGGLLKGPKQQKTSVGNLQANGSKSSPPPLPTETRKRRLEDLTWDEFEMLVGEIYRRQGYSVAISAADGADGGIDLDLTNEDERVLVQCKHWRNSKVTAKEVREFFGVLISENATRGIVVTSSNYTRDALDFAAGKPITMIDRNALEELIVMAKHDPDDDLLNVRLWAPFFVNGAQVLTPSCQFCRKEMVLRNGSRGRFWGCANFPRCRGKRQARAHLLR